MSSVRVSCPLLAPRPLSVLRPLPSPCSVPSFPEVPVPSPRPSPPHALSPRTLRKLGISVLHWTSYFLSFF